MVRIACNRLYPKRVRRCFTAIADEMRIGNGMKGKQLFLTREDMVCKGKEK